MEQTIAKHLAITYLDSRFDKCSSAMATMQLESYYTDDEPQQRIGVINHVTRKYTFNVGDTVNVEPKIIINNGLMLTNIIRTNFLNEYIQNQR